MEELLKSKHCKSLRKRKYVRLHNSSPSVRTKYQFGAEGVFVPSFEYIGYGGLLKLSTNCALPLVLTVSFRNNSVDSACASLYVGTYPLFQVFSMASADAKIGLSPLNRLVNLCGFQVPSRYDFPIDNAASGKLTFTLISHHPMWMKWDDLLNVLNDLQSDAWVAPRLSRPNVMMKHYPTVAHLRDAIISLSTINKL